MSRFDELPTVFLQKSFLDLLAVQLSGQGSVISCGNCRKKSAEASFCFECREFMCPDCVNAHERLKNVAFDGHKITSVKHFQTKDYEALLKRPSFCSQQYHEQEVTRFFCIDCQTSVCQICIVTDHRNHIVELLDRAADGEKARLMTGTEVLKEKSNVCNGVIREFEQTLDKLETNILNAKREVSRAAEQMITKVRQSEREEITALENMRVLKTEEINAAVRQVQSLVKQIDQALAFTNNLIQRSSSSDIMQSKKHLEQRFELLNKTPVPALPVSSFVKFVATADPQSLALGYTETNDVAVEGLNQDFQAGVKAELVICPKLISEAQEKFNVEVVVGPAEKVRSLTTCKKQDGNLLLKFTPKVPASYEIYVTLNGGTFQKSGFTIQVKERRLEVVGELDLKGETFQNPHGIAVNSKGLITVADCNGHRVLIFDKQGKYLRELGCKGEKEGEVNYPTGVTFLGDSKILVADFLNHRIQLFNLQTGKLVKTFGKCGSGDGELQNPTSVCVDGEGRVVVADCVNNRIQVFTKDGVPLFKFGDSGPGKLDHPTGCIYHQNKFIVSDTNNDCLKIFDCAGKLVRKIGRKGKGDGQLSWPQSLCVEKCGSQHNILVCDSGNGRIVQFSEDGSFTGETVTKLQDPIAIATTPDSRILVSDFEAKKVYFLKLK